MSDLVLPWAAASPEGRSLCNHRRAYKFFTDSVSPKCHFPAFPCADYDTFLEVKFHQEQKHSHLIPKLQASLKLFVLGFRVVASRVALIEDVVIWATTPTGPLDEDNFIYWLEKKSHSVVCSSEYIILLNIGLLLTILYFDLPQMTTVLLPNNQSLLRRRHNFTISAIYMPKFRESKKVSKFINFNYFHCFQRISTT